MAKRLVREVELAESASTNAKRKYVVPSAILSPVSRLEPALKAAIYYVVAYIHHLVLSEVIRIVHEKLIIVC